MTNTNTLPCWQCGGLIQFDSQQAGTTVACPHCSKDTKLKEKPRLTIAPESSALNAKNRLDFLRKNSCYKALRAIIDIATAICGLSCVVSLFVVFRAIGDMMIFGTAVSMIILVVYLAAVELLLLAFRQACSLLIDVADSALQHHANH